MMNKRIALLSLASLLIIGPISAMATEQNTAESAAPPNALPGVNHSKSSSAHDDKADKKGEESSGGNAGAESHETEKDAATSSDSEDIKKAPKP
ncbi:hypothetical protein PS898_01998 [Pseudomonas fluorescens]|nr:hypothetical protein PS898_01998 [Pseudomonas fluorescens]